MTKQRGDLCLEAHRRAIAGVTPLQAAAEAGNMRTLELLLSRLWPKIADQAEHLNATSAGQADIVQQLLQALQPPRQQLDVALYIAACSGRMSTVQQLAAAGAQLPCGHYSSCLQPCRAVITASTGVSGHEEVDEVTPLHLQLVHGLGDLFLTLR